MFKDKVSIRVSDNNNYMSEIRINGKTIPFIYSYNLQQRVGETPVLDLELDASNLDYNGKADINIDNLICGNKKMAKEIYDTLKEKYDFE